MSEDSDSDEKLPLSTLLKLMHEKRDSLELSVLKTCRKPDVTENPARENISYENKNELLKDEKEQAEKYSSDQLRSLDYIVKDKRDNENASNGKTSRDNHRLTHVLDADPPYIHTCKVEKCSNQVFSSCHMCHSLLCNSHFMNKGLCENNHDMNTSEPSCKKRKSSTILEHQNFPSMVSEGKEGGVAHIAERRENNKKDPHNNNNIQGKECVNSKTGKRTPTRNILKPRCNGVICEKLNKKCSSFSDEQRNYILQAYYGTKSLQLQREYIVNLVKVDELSCYYSLPKNEKLIPVCKTMFLNTLNISEKTLRTAIKKKQPTGVADVDKRGGRPECRHQDRKSFLEYFRFPQMESHICENNSKQNNLIFVKKISIGSPVKKVHEKSNDLSISELTFRPDVSENLDNKKYLHENKNDKIEYEVSKDEAPLCKGKYSALADQLEAMDNVVTDKSSNENVSFKSEKSRVNDILIYNNEDSHYVGTCKVQNCPNEVFSSCHRCHSPLCNNHFMNMGQCENDHEIKQSIKPSCKINKMHATPDPESTATTLVPGNSSFGEEMEREKAALVRIAKRKENIKEIAHTNRIQGNEYVSPKTGKNVPARNILKPGCNGITCEKLSKKCSSFSEEQRKDILQAYYGTNSLQLQREFIVHLVKVDEVKRKRIRKHESRRSLSYYYSLPRNGEFVPVCKTMFLNTLNISEKTLRTAIRKKQPMGTLEVDKRGGRSERLQPQDKQRREAILEHIRTFVQMESNNCQELSKRQYLYPDLNKKIMYDKFMEEYAWRGITASYTTYCSVLKSQDFSLIISKDININFMEASEKEEARKG